MAENLPKRLKALLLDGVLIVVSGVAGFEVSSRLVGAGVGRDIVFSVCAGVCLIVLRGILGAATAKRGD